MATNTQTQVQATETFAEELLRIEFEAYERRERTRLAKVEAAVIAISLVLGKIKVPQLKEDIRKMAVRGSKLKDRETGKSVFNFELAVAPDDDVCEEVLQICVRPFILSALGEGFDVSTLNRWVILNW